MPDLVVVNEPQWKPRVRSECFSTPAINLSVKFAGADLDEMTDKHRKAFDKHFKQFDARFKTLRDSKEKEIQEAMDWTEKRIREKKTQETPDQVVATANKLLEQAVKVFEQQVQSLAQECYDLAIAKAFKEMNMRLLKARAKAIVKIVLISALILTAAALTIAASVATGGALAPLILGAVVTGAGAIYKVYKEVDGGWANASNQIKTIQKDIANLEKTVVALKLIDEQQKKFGAAALAGKLKTAQTLIATKMIDLDKHVGQLDKFVFEARESLKSQTKKVAELTAKAKESGDPKLVDKALELESAMTESLAALAEMNAVTAAAAKVRADLAAQKIPELGTLGKLVAKLSSAGPFIKKVVSGVKEVLTLAKALAPA